jgi:hypothetical protein
LVGREYFLYKPQAGALAALEAVVMLEAGVQSGDHPVAARPIQSLVAEFLDQRGVVSGAEDQPAFAMTLLHFRRTFVEKLFTIHDRVERLVKQRGQPLGSYARHYYDLFRLLHTEEVRTMLTTGEYSDIAADYRRLTREHYPRQVLPAQMELRRSSALFPEAKLRLLLQHSYSDQCARLCYGTFPAFEEVLAAFESIQEHLVPVVEAG